ncbi:MAG: amidase family protein, partial [Pseudomonadota bacterium]|nr:amidase family protein [Pseudomonadota bacterium]
STGEGELDAFRTAALELLCPAGLAGLPQVSLPAGTVDGAPVGLSLIGPPGGDGQLLAMAEALTAP